MRIFHNLGLRAGERQRAAFRQAGIELPSGARSAGMVSVEIPEDDPRWPLVAPLRERFRIVDTVSTQFTAAELDRAQWLGMVATGLHGYPEPSEDRRFLNATFDLTGYCQTCGSGLKQSAPFRLKKPPAGKRSILQLNWVLDEFFVTPDIWEAVFLPHDVRCRSVVLHKTAAVLSSVAQLDIPGIRDLSVEERSPEICPACGRPKYRYSLRGPYPEPVNADSAIFKSSQYFGSGAQALRLVLVSNPLYRSMRDAGLRGVVFYPAARALRA